MRNFVVLTFLKRGNFTLVKILSMLFSHVHTDQPHIHVYIFYELAKILNSGHKEPASYESFHDRKIAHVVFLSCKVVLPYSVYAASKIFASRILALRRMITSAMHCGTA